MHARIDSARPLHFPEVANSRRMILWYWFSPSLYFVSPILSSNRLILVICLTCEEHHFSRLQRHPCERILMRVVLMAERRFRPWRRVSKERTKGAGSPMVNPDDLRYTKIALNNGSGAIPALGFGTLIPDPVATKNATKAALEAGFRVLDTAERYRTEKEVGEAMQEVFKAGKIKREDVFVVTKLWNTNHRPERVKPAFEASLKKLQLDYVDLYLIHTPFAFQPGDEQDPRDANGNVIYDKGVTLLDTWGALEDLVDEGKCKAIGLSDVSLEKVKEIFEAATIKPAVVHVESHPYLPEWELLDYCRKRWHRAASFRRPGP